MSIFVVLCTAPTKYSIAEPQGEIRAQHSVDTYDNFSNIILIIFLILLELYAFLIRHHHQQIKMLYIKFVYNFLIVENLKILLVNEMLFVQFYLINHWNKILMKNMV